MARLLIRTVWVIYRERRRVIRARERGDLDVQPNLEALIAVLVAFRKAALDLGVLMIKLGQFLSSRADILPEQALKVLTSLQDEVPAAPFEHVVSVIEQELGKPIEELFSQLDPRPAAAASLGQVHRGVLAATGETVAVKVQRPHIDRLVAMDLSTIRFVIWLLTRFGDTGEMLDLMGLFREFKRTIAEEIDYVAEAANARRFRELFANRPEIVIPRVHDEYVSRRVLVLEWIEGFKINDYPGLEAGGIDRVAAATRTVEAYLHQFFSAGFFHADPHPGNIFIQPGSDGSGPSVAFVDFGMVGSLSKGTKQSLKDLFFGFLTGDARGMAAALNRLGFVGEGANLAAIERGIALLLEQYRGITLGEARDLDFSGVARDIEELLYSQPFRVPARLAFAGKAVGTLSGVATGLAPELNLLDVAVPYARRFLGLNAEGASQTAQQAAKQLIDMGKSVLALPGTIDRVLSRLETGQIEVGLAGESRYGSRRRRARRSGFTSSGGLASVASVVALLAAGVVLQVNHAVGPGWFCLAVAGLTAVVELFRR